ARLKRLRPACTVTLSPDWLTVTLLPSGRARTISNSLRAGIVVSPSWASSTAVRATISTSRSVPVSDSWPSRTRTSRLASTGRVWRRSTTLTTCANGLSSTSRCRENRMSTLAPLSCRAGAAMLPALGRWINQETGGAWWREKPRITYLTICFNLVFLNFTPSLKPSGKLGTACGWIGRAGTMHRLSTACPALPGNSLAELPDQLFPVLVQLADFLHQVADLPAGVQDGGVVAALEGHADLRQAVLGQFLGRGHGDLPRARQRAGPFLPQHLPQLQTVVVCHGLLDVGDADRLLLRAPQVAEGFLGELHGHRAAEQPGLGGQLVDRAFQLAHVAAHLLGDQLGHLVRDRGAALARLAEHDLGAGLEVGRVDRHRQAPAQPRLQPRLQPVDLARVAVAGQDDLLAAV